MTIPEAYEAWRDARAHAIQAERQLLAAEALVVKRREERDLAIHYVALSQITLDWTRDHARP